MTIHPEFICRSCGSQELIQFLDLGKTPLANRLLTSKQLSEVEPKFDLQLFFCQDCSLCQLKETISPESLFSDYVYFTSYSETMLRHCKTLSQIVTQRLSLGPDSLVVDIASNDGYLLQYYKAAGIRALGIEPAANIAQIAMSKYNIPTIMEFFSEKLAISLQREGKQADVIHGLNVLAHATYLNDFVSGLKQLIKEAGTIIIEVPYILDLIEKREFDTIYHEHLCYFSVSALTQLFQRHGLHICDIERVPIHGGSLRLWIMTKVDRRTSSVKDLLELEQSKGVTDLSFYRRFSTQVEELRRKTVDLLKELKREGKSIAAYGASAKGSTLMNYYQIPQGIIDFVVDRNPVKQGLFTPGTHLPILPVNSLLERMPDYVLLLIWNLKDEVIAQQSEYRKRGGKFIVPIPNLTVVES